MVSNCNLSLTGPSAMGLVSTVVPVYHNAKSLPDLASRLQSLALKNDDLDFEFIFVEDGSRDDSLTVLQALASKDHRIRIFKLSRNFGANAAVLAGLSHAAGDAIAVIAADLQDPPELIHEMLTLWRQGRKVVLAARETRNDPRISAFLSNTFYALFRRFAIKTMPEGGFDFFLIDRLVCDLIKNIQESNAYLMGLILWFGFEPAVIHYHRTRRKKQYGKSMWSLTKRIKYFIDSFVAFSYIPIRFSSLLGVCLSIIGLGYAVVVVFARLFLGVAVEGWTSIMVALLVVSGVQMIMMGMLGEYVWRNLDETRRRPRFIVERIIDGGETASRMEATEKAPEPATNS